MPGRAATARTLQTGVFLFSSGPCPLGLPFLPPQPRISKAVGSREHRLQHVGRGRLHLASRTREAQAAAAVDDRQSGDAKALRLFPAPWESRTAGPRPSEEGRVNRAMRAEEEDSLSQ